MDKPFKIKDAKIGDECYFRGNFQKAPLKGKIEAIYESEDAVGIMTYTVVAEPTSAYRSGQVLPLRIRITVWYDNKVALFHRSDCPSGSRAGSMLV